MQFYTIKIKEVKFETSDTLILYLDIPKDLKNKFQFTPGQYITIAENIKGEEIRRSYSICSAPWEPYLAIGVKKVKGGILSNHIHNQYKAGNDISISAPEGNFIVQTDDATQRDHYFIAAGSGITPILSMIKAILEEEPLSKAYLLYGNRNRASIIFKDAIEEMQSKYTGQLEVAYTLTKPAMKKAKGLLGIIKPKKSDWDGFTGRISKSILKKFLEANPAQSKEVNYYLCGPGNMIETIESHLKSIGTTSKHIHKEFFISGTGISMLSDAEATHSKITVELNGESFTYESEGKIPLLEEIINLKKDPPYSCTSGACSSCVAKVTEGKAEMEVCYALDDDEVEAGYILTCQARAKTSTLNIVFE